MFFSKDQSKLMRTVTSQGQIHFHPLNDKLILQVPLSKLTFYEKVYSLPKFQVMSAIRSYEFQKWAFLLELLLLEIMAVYTRIFKNTKEKITLGGKKQYQS